MFPRCADGQEGSWFMRVVIKPHAAFNINLKPLRRTGHVVNMPSKIKRGVRLHTKTISCAEIQKSLRKWHPACTCLTGPGLRAVYKIWNTGGRRGGAAGSNHFLGLVLDPEELLENKHKDNVTGWKKKKKKSTSEFNVYLFTCSHVTTCNNSHINSTSRGTLQSNPQIYKLFSTQRTTGTCKKIHMYYHCVITAADMTLSHIGRKTPQYLGTTAPLFTLLIHW